jgi:hypothetical protein
MSIGPAQPPPPPTGAGPDLLAELAATAPDVLNDAVNLIAETVGAPPEQVAQTLQAMPVPERNELLGAVLAELQQRLAAGQGSPPGGPGIPDPGAPPPGMGAPPPMMGPPGMMPPGAGPPGMMGGPPVPIGGPIPPPSSPAMGPGAVPGPSLLPAEPPVPEDDEYLGEVEDEEKETPAPDDWEPEALSDLHGKGYAWREKPTHEEICTLAREALDDAFHQERLTACYDQSNCYYRSRLWAKHNGLPFSFLQGDLTYMLSTPSKQVDRIVARSQPRPENLTFSLDPRAEREEYADAAQHVENIGRDWWRKHTKRWWDDLSQTREGATLERTLTHLDALHGAVGFSLRPDVRRRKGAKKRDINAHHPVILDIIPQHELFKLGDCTLRIQSVTLKEARKLSAEVRDRWPSRPKDEQDTAEWQPSDDQPTRLISFSDRHGKWYAQCFDICAPEGKSPEEGQHWTIEPEQIDFGFCLFQLPPGWQSTGDNALADTRQPAENYGRNFARGVLFANLEDFHHQDQAASAAISAFRYNRNPASIDKINYKLRQEAGQPLPDPLNLAEGGRNERDVSEDGSFIPKNFADNPSDNFALSMMFSQTADTFPAALGGGGAAQSGYDRRQMVENAQLLHVEEIRQHVAGVVEQIIRLSLTLIYRYGTAKKSTFADLPFRMSKGGTGEARLTMRDLERAGVDVEVEYFEQDIEADLRKNNIYLPRLAAGVNSKETTRELLGTPEPEKEETRIDDEFAVTRALLGMTKRRNPLLPFLREAAAMEKQQQQGMGGPPGMVGLPSAPGVPPGGGEPSVERGMPPGMRMPPGL